MLKVEIKTSGSAFQDENEEFDCYNGGKEIKRVLQKVTTDIQDGYTEGTVNDINGNKVCKWTLEN